MTEKRKRGRPKVKHGKRTTIYLSKEAHKKLMEMTMVTRNASALIEALINKAYFEGNHNGKKEREGLDKSKF